jgi:hypothetical protein
MPWSIFTEGGGPAAAVSWAKDLISAAGLPDTPAVEKFVYDWEVSEGGGGLNNPLNQGPVPGHPELTTTGSQFGGGAADFASRDAGISGAVDYLAMPNYSGVKAALMGGDPVAALRALVASPWAGGHYGGGTGFSTIPLGADPHKVSSTAAEIAANVATAGQGSTAAGTKPNSPSSTAAKAGSLPNPFGVGKLALEVVVVGAGLGLVLLGAWRTVSPAVQKVESRVQAGAETAAKVGAVAA